MAMQTEALTEAGVLRLPVDVGVDEALGWYEREGRRFTALVRRIDDGDRRAAGLEWTLAETAVHLLDVLRHYRDGILGRLEPHVPIVDNPTRFIAVENEKAIAAEPERRPQVLADQIDQALDEMLATVRDAGPDAVAKMDAGHALDMPSLLCGHIGEFLVHGLDIARTIDAPWPIEHRAAVLAVHGTSAAISLALDRRAAADTELNVHVRLRRGEPFAIRVSQGEVWTEPPRGRPDLTMSADPTAYLLVGFGRLPMWRPALQGKVVAWGRKPWVVLTLPKLFHKP
jgi:hypothetical protein